MGGQDRVIGICLVVRSAIDSQTVMTCSSGRPCRSRKARAAFAPSSEADDALQEAWLRIRDQEPGTVENLRASPTPGGAWTTTRRRGRSRAACMEEGIVVGGSTAREP
jgi:hypothetical protein